MVYQEVNVTMKILVTGFEPFGQEKANSSWEAVKKFTIDIEGLELKKVCLPVSYKRAVTALKQEIDTNTPDVVLSVGQSKRYEVNVERIAINMAHSKKPDNDGYQPNEVTISSDAPDAYFSNLPVAMLVNAIHDVGIPATVSNSAGLYVCNSVFFTAMHMVHCKYPKMRVGFVHIPYMPCQAVGKSNQPSMETETAVKALEAVIQYLAREYYREIS